MPWSLDGTDSFLVPEAALLEAIQSAAGRVGGEPALVDPERSGRAQRVQVPVEGGGCPLPPLVAEPRRQPGDVDFGVEVGDGEQGAGRGELGGQGPEGGAVGARVLRCSGPDRVAR